MLKQECTETLRRLNRLLSVRNVPEQTTTSILVGLDAALRVLFLQDNYKLEYYEESIYPDTINGANFICFVSSVRLYLNCEDGDLCYEGTGEIKISDLITSVVSGNPFKQQARAAAICNLIQQTGNGL